MRSWGTTFPNGSATCGNGHGDPATRRYGLPEPGRPGCASRFLTVGALVTRHHNLIGEAKRDYRLTHTKPLVDAFFDWSEGQLQHAALLPSNPLTKALYYALERSDGLRINLSDPDAAIDTNHLERALRSIPLGRKNKGSGSVVRS